MSEAMRILEALPRDLGGTEPSPLRHSVPALGVSTIAGQWYCELKTELGHRHPEVQVASPALDRGNLGHHELSTDAVPISPDEFESRVLADQDIYLQESRFTTQFEGANLVGVPDLVHLRGLQCRMVLEMKFSRRTNLFIDRLIQVQTYALLLQGNGYRTADTACVVGVVKTPARRNADESKLDSLRRQGLLQDILRRAEELREQAKSSEPVVSREGPATLHAFRFDPVLARSHLRWALDYWRGKREPVATRHASKCRSCPFNAALLCSRALAAPDPRLRVDRSAVDGRPVVRVLWKEDPLP